MIIIFILFYGHDNIFIIKSEAIEEKKVFSNVAWVQLSNEALSTV